MPKIIFIGAGPVGLFAAIQLKLQNPEASILMLEKYPEYKRNHPLLLSRESFKGMTPNPDLKKFVDGLHHTIPTSELESKLLSYARTLGIEIEYKEVILNREDKSKSFNDTLTCDELCKLYPEAEMVVGADGSHSVIHQQIFNHEYQKKKTLEYIAEIKYAVSGKARVLNKITEYPLAIYNGKHFVTELIGKEKEGKTPVSIRMFIDEKIYQAMKEASFKNPYHLSDISKLCDSHLDCKPLHRLHKTIHTWLIARKEMTGEKFIEESERITVTTLPVYASKDFTKKHQGKTWFLVGDAAFGVPYFRSLNNGILCSSQLAKSITTIIQADHSGGKKLLKPEQKYHQYVQKLVNNEFFAAKNKTLGVHSLETSAKISQLIYQGLNHVGSKIPLADKISPQFSMTTGGKRYKERVIEERDKKKATLAGAKALSIWLHSGSHILSPTKISQKKDEAEYNKETSLQRS